MPGVGLAVRPIVAMANFDFPRFRSSKTDLRWAREPQDMVSYELTFHLLAGKLRLAAYSIPHGLEGKRGVAFRAGMADLPGVAYWIWK
jgi:hypothetical protein